MAAKGPIIMAGNPLLSEALAATIRQQAKVRAYLADLDKGGRAGDDAPHGREALRRLTDALDRLADELNAAEQHEPLESA